MPDLIVDIKDGLATLTLNRPEARNALSMEMRSGLKDTLHRIEHDPEVRCVVIRGQGEHFMAGGDVKGMHETLAEQENAPTGEAKRYWNLRIHDAHPVLFALRRIPKPVVASVQGAAAGAGVSLLLACDLVVAAESSFLTLAYVHIGTSPDWGATFQLPRNVGAKRAMEIALLGERIDAETALAWGLVNRVVPDSELEAETSKLCGRLLAGPTRAYGEAKKLIYASLERQLESQLQAEAESFAHCATGPDFKEGVAAFVEKRKSSFSGK